jgi:glucokinase
LGEAVLVHTGSRYEVVPSEGGHGDFAPRNELEMGLLRHLLGRFPDHVSYERVVSGPGLVNVYDYLRDAGVVAEAPAVREAMAREDRGAVIGRHAVGGSDPLCVKAVELFGGVYGAEAGNLALKVLASGGVYLLGGIAAKILPCLEQGSFVAGYLAKGRLRRVVERYPVRVVINPRFGLLGAAVRASQVQA